MNRRQFIATGAVATITGAAGCLSDDGNGDGDGNGNGDGYSPDLGSESIPEERSIDTDAYLTKTFDGVEVPLAPIDDVYYWYLRQEARMADARGADQYEQKHVAGAVLSTAPPQTPSDDPVADWPTDDRIVTYCGCPHHLSGLRAAALLDNGYEEVYALYDGFGTWESRGYPMQGTDVSSDRLTYEISGQSDPAYAGEMVRLEQLDAERYEANHIAADGSYTLQLHYSGSTDSRFRVEAPDYTMEGTLEELTTTTVTA